MLTVENQQQLPLSRAPDRLTVPLEFIWAKKTSGAAFVLACETSGLEDQEIGFAVGIEPGYFSNIKKSKATLQGDKIAKFCEVVGNRIYPEWIAYQVGCTLVQIKSDAERQRDAEKARADALQMKLDLAMEMLQRRVA